MHNGQVVIRSMMELKANERNKGGNENERSYSLKRIYFIISMVELERLKRF